MTLTELDRQAVARAFDKAADVYDDYAVLQQEVESRLLERVAYFELTPRRVLDLGCGTGRGSAALAASFADADIVMLDRAPGMLRHSRQRAPNAGAVCADMHQLPFAPGRFDLVFSSLAVQWSTEEPRLFQEVRRILRPGGLFLFTSFGPDTLHELRSAWAAAEDGRQHVNRFPDMHDVGDALVKAGFRDPVMDREEIVLEYGDVRTLMRELKAIGAGNAARDRAPGLTGKARLRRVLEAYEQHRRGDRYPASYEVVYGAAFAPPEGQPVRTPTGEEATFSIDALRKERRRS